MKIIELLLRFLIRMAEILMRLGFQLLFAILLALWKGLVAVVAHLWARRQAEKVVAASKRPHHSHRKSRRASWKRS